MFVVVPDWLDALWNGIALLAAGLGEADWLLTAIWLVLLLIPILPFVAPGCRTGKPLRGPGSYAAVALVGMGNAQVGSWLSWQDHRRPVSRNCNTTTVTATDLLANTVL